jgi:hypothetical protein
VKDIRKVIQRWLRWRGIPFVIHPSGNILVRADNVAFSKHISGDNEILFYFGDYVENRVLIVCINKRLSEDISSFLNRPDGNGVA